VVGGKLELAQAELDNRDYAKAAETAREALELASGNEEAKAIRDQADRLQRELEAAVADARKALAEKRTQEGQQALSRVLALDARHEVVAQLSPWLNQTFRQQAEDARRQAAASRREADAGRATGVAEYAEARRLSAQAEASFSRQEFTTSAQQYLGSRDGFDAARRAAAARAQEAERAAAVALPRPAPPPASAAPAAQMAPSSPTLAPPITPPMAAPTPLLTPVPLPTVASIPVPAPAAPAPAPAAAADTRMAEIERVLQGYKRAYETRDAAALRGVMDVSPQLEKGLRDLAKAVKSYGIEFQARQVDFEGDARARVRVSRQDTVDGRRQPPLKQTFVLERPGGGWRIMGTSFEK
jgi:hypothetical protein